MSNPSHEPEHQAESRTCWIVAIARIDSLPELREALRSIEPLSVTTSLAATWDFGQKLSYRGVEFRSDAAVVRLEIACNERKATWVVGAIHRVFERTGATPGPAQHVMALQPPLTLGCADPS